jgi:choline dehydrogenase-like flavoprotein
VTFQATLGPSYVTASPAQIHQTIQGFLHGGTAPGRIGIASINRSKAHHRAAAGARLTVPLAPATADELAQARSIATTLPFKLYYPASRITAAGAPADEMRSYSLNRHPAYVIVVAQGELGQYYDLEGTTWTNPPILGNPNQTIQLGGRRMRLYFEGQRLRVVAWRDGPAVYWLVNTLQNILTNRQMLAIASAAHAVP